MSIPDILHYLYSERDKTAAAIEALERLQNGTITGKRRGRKSIGPYERAAISARMKRYWAARRMKRYWAARRTE
jgi:hypothetical protein